MRIRCGKVGDNSISFPRPSERQRGRLAYSQPVRLMLKVVGKAFNFAYSLFHMVPIPPWALLPSRGWIRLGWGWDVGTRHCSSPRSIGPGDESPGMVCSRLGLRTPTCIWQPLGPMIQHGAWAGNSNSIEYSKSGSGISSSRTQKLWEI